MNLRVPAKGASPLLISMKNSRTWVLAILASLLAVAAVHSQPSPTAAFVYYARVDHILTSSISTSILFSEGQVIEIAAPPPPAGYELAFMRVEFPNGLPKGIVPVKADKSEVIDEQVTALVSYSGSIKLAASEANASCDAKVTVSYVKTSWLQLKSGNVSFTVEEPPPPFTKSDLTVRFTIENHAPFAIQDVKGPDGGSLLNNEPSPDAIRVDYKHVELNFKYLDIGSYTINVVDGEEYTLPSAFIVMEPPFKEDTVSPGASKRFGIGQVKGWRGIGAVVVVYSIAPLTSRKSGSVDIVGELVDFAYYKDEIITIKAASFLIPNLNMRLYIKAYIVYGSWFEIRNTMGSTVNVMYTTVFIKEAGDWLPGGVSITVRDSDIKDAMAAYLVVQVPSYGKIVSAKTPSGAELGGTLEGLLPWGSEYRDVRVFMNEAYIQVKAFNSAELGSYFFKIDWGTISFKLVDDGGEPVTGATVVIAGPINATTVSDENGVASFKAYKPGAYVVDVYFKGVPVAKLYLGTLTGGMIAVKCSVYRVSWLVVNAWDQPVSGAELIIKNGDAVVSRVITGEGGVTPVIQIPQGQFAVQINYKRVTSTKVESINSSGLRKAKLDILFELPLFGGIPVTTLEAALAGTLTSGGAAGLAFAKRRKASSTEEIAIEE